MKTTIESQKLIVIPKNEIHYCDFIPYGCVGHECNAHAMVYVNIRVKRIARNNRWITTDYHRHYCAKHLLDMAAVDSEMGEAIRNERLRILVLTGLNVCEKVE